MKKQKAIEKLILRIQELEELPNYSYRGTNSEFDKWKRFTEKTIQNLLKEEDFKDFKKINYSATSFIINGDNSARSTIAHNRGREKAKGMLESFIDEINEFWEDEEKIDVIEVETKKLKTIQSLDKSKVFIVHGHDNEMKFEVARFIEKLGFEPVILHEQASEGKTIIEKIEAHTNVGFGIVLYSPCDIGGKSENNLSPRARQNVVFEHGFLIAKLERKNVVALVKGKVETPGDISGVVYVEMNSSWQQDIAKELKSAEYAVDFNKLFE